jgi:hypothetical protein
MSNTPSAPSRRAWLKAASVAFAAASLPVIALGDDKVAKAVAHYQGHPHSGKMCGMCRFFIAQGATSPDKGMMGSGGMMHEGSCQLVAGSIRPMGYCQLYQPLNKT